MPKSVINVLEKDSAKYRQLMGLNPRSNQSKSKNTSKDKKKNSEQKIEVIDSQIKTSRLNSPVIIPSSVNTEKVKRIIKRESNKSEVIRKTCTRYCEENSKESNKKGKCRR